MLFHVLHLVFTSCHGIATSSRCSIVPRYVIGPYVMSVLVIMSQCMLSSSCVSFEIKVGMLFVCKFKSS